MANAAEKNFADTQRDLAAAMSTLASRPAPTGKRPLTGRERAAVLMLALGEQYGAKIWGMLDDDELRELSVAMSAIGAIEADVVENLLLEFVSRMSASGAIMGTYEQTERLLQQFLPPEKVDAIMEEIRGPAGRTMWDKLGNVNEAVLANYLKNEYPQTVAVVLSKIKAEHAARVLAALPEDFALEVRHAHAAHGAGAARDPRQDRADAAHRVHVQPGAHLQARQPRDDGRDLQQLRPPDREPLHRRAGRAQPRERRAHPGADVRVRGPRPSSIPGGVQTLLRAVEKDQLALALKGASDALREMFFSNMSERAAKIMREDMESMGPVRLRDVDAAQMAMVQVAKDLAAKGEIMLAGAGGDDELIY